MQFTKGKTIILIAIIVGASIAGIGIGLWFFINTQSENVLENTEVSINNVEIISADNDSVEVRIIGNIINPSGISAILDPMTLAVDYQGVQIGTTQTVTINVVGTNTPFNFTTTISISNFEQFSKFLDAFIENESVNLEISGTATIHAVGISINKNIVKTIAMNGMDDKLNFTVVDFKIINASSTDINANLTIEIENPSSITLNLNNINFNISWQNKILGQLDISTLKILGGIHNTTLIGRVILKNSTLFDEMVDQLLNNTDIQLNMQGLKSSNNILSNYISKLNINVIMPGLKAFDCIILAIRLIDSTNESFDLSVDLQIYNPTSGPVNIYNITFNTTYKGDQLGTVVFPDLTVESGTKTYTVNVTFILTNTTMLSEILTKYLSGEEINITFIGVADGTDVIAQMLDGYQRNVTLPAFTELQYSIGIMNFVNATEQTLTFNTTITMENPSPLNILLNNSCLDTYYQDYWAGNITFGFVNLTPGINVIDIQVIISGEKNSSNIEDLLSEYINGNDVIINIIGNLSIKLSGMAEPINVTFKLNKTITGFQGQLVKGVKLNFITLAVYPNMLMQAHVNATIYNPFNFTINITYLEYDVYFDDEDGYVIVISPLITFSGDKKMNIYIDTITKNYTSSPLEIPANSTREISETISTTSEDIYCRLYDEYYQDNDLYIDVKNGKMQVDIGGFRPWITVEIYDIYVPET